MVRDRSDYRHFTETDMSRIILRDAYKKETRDQDKVIAPEETVRRFMDKIKHLNLNILEQIQRIDNGRLDIPVYFSLCGSDALALTGTKKQMGKGATPRQAEASAVMELAERFSFFSFYTDSRNFVTDQCRNLKDQAVPFRLIADSVHDRSEDAEAVRSIFESLPLRWAKGYNLTQDREMLIPFDWFYTISEFNGACAGNCQEEALVQGICEVVERHVSSVISREGRKVPLLDPDSAIDPLVREMMGKYRNAGINLWVSDFSLDTGIPTVGVLAFDPSTFPASSEIVWTAGTATSPQKALSRALSETAQLGGDFNTGSNYVASGLPKFSRLEDAGFVTNPGKRVSLSDLPDLSNDNIRVEIQNLVSALSGQGRDVLAVNTTHPLLEIPAFYIIVPGLHFRERAENSSAGMFCAKLIAERNPPRVAIARLHQMEKQVPGRYYVQFFLGISHLAEGDPETALSCLETALELHPNPQDIPGIYSYMGMCLKDMGQYGSALEVLTKGGELDPDRTDIHNFMGFCHFKLKQHEKAIDCFQKVLRLNPSSAIDHANIGVNYREMGEKEKAVAWFEMALKMDPDIGFARDSLKKLREGN